uniref:G domain-containing protein n=1 Tax=Panagrolaimus sp. JU765 TaxID=591449 RepID=A0AC34QH02_9BILA
MRLIFGFIFLLTILNLVTCLDSLLSQSMELDKIDEPLNLPTNSSVRRPIYPPRRHHKKLYEEVIINDPQEKSAGLYVRLSQKGADYLTKLLSKGMPQLLEQLVLPTIEVSSFTGSNFVITKFHEPLIKAKFVDKTGISMNIKIPFVEVEGDCSIDMFFTAESHMLATLKNWTIEMDISIVRALEDDRNTINVTKCSGNVPVNLQFFGGDADSLNSFKDLVASEVETAIKDKLCLLPIFLNEFMEKQQQEILSEQFWNETHIAEKTGSIGPKIEDHLCSDLFGQIESDVYEEPQIVDYSDEHGALQDFGNDLKDVGTWAPDLTLRFPLTFSNKDVIVGIDGGIVLNGITADVERPKLPNVTVIRDQMAGLIVSEYVPNAFFYHVFEKSLGSFTESFNLRHVPKSLRPFARIICSDCMVLLKANLTQRPHITIDNNGIVLVLEGDIGAHFLRKNKTRDLLSADGVIRVVLKPQFRHSRIFSDVELTGVDFKVYKVRSKVIQVEFQEQVKMRPRRVLVFGCSKAGKTSMLNTITGQKMKVSDAALGTTFKTRKFDDFEYNGKTYQFIDTAGLDEGDKGTTSCAQAMKNLINFIKDDGIEGFNLFVMVMSKGIISKAIQNNYELIAEHIRTEKIPTLCVVTRCENDDPLDKWVDENKDVFEETYGIKFTNMIGSCFAQEWEGRLGETYKRLCEESRKEVMDMIEITCSETPRTIIQGGFLKTLKKIWNAFVEIIKCPSLRWDNQNIYTAMNSMNISHSETIEHIDRINERLAITFNNEYQK